MIQAVVDSPLLILVVTFASLWATARITASYVRRRRLHEDVREDYDFLLSATLTLLSLIIGFNMFAAVSRYDQRKNFEEAEANAIGTEYLRTDLMPAAEGSEVRALLAAYVQQRILFYTSHDGSALVDINNRTARLQDEMWKAVVGPSLARPDPIQALVVSGMNDVMNTQADAQASWWNRIPLGAWGLMMAMALAANILVGFGVRNEKQAGAILLILPFVVSISFFLIADIDSPRQGVIRVEPMNVQALAASLKPR